MRELHQRLKRLEERDDNAGKLPVIVPDETDDAELERLRREHGPRVARLSEAVHWFV